MASFASVRACKLSVPVGVVLYHSVIFYFLPPGSLTYIYHAAQTKAGIQRLGQGTKHKFLKKLKFTHTPDPTHKNYNVHVN